MKQSSWSQVRLRVPPVTGARGAAASAQYALIHPVQLRPVLLALQDLLPGRGWRALPLQPRLDALVLVVEVGHVHDQVLDDEHVRQRRDRRGGPVGDLGEAGEAVAAVDVHGAGPADALAAGPPEGEGRIDLVLDLDEGVEDHGAALPEVDLVVLELRLRGVVRGPPVDREGLEVGGGLGPGLDLLRLRLRLARVAPGEEEAGRRRRRRPGDRDCPLQDAGRHCCRASERERS